MALINKPFTFSAGATIVAAEHNSNFDVVYNEFNGNISNANISGSAAITDSKFAQITTAGKVSGAALTLLTSTPSGAGILPIANLATGTPDGTKFLRDDGTLQVPNNTAATALSGSVIQTVNTQTASVDTTTTTFTSNNSSRTTSEGKNFFNRAITPNNASNLLEIVVIVNLAASGTSGSLAAWLTQDAGTNAICTGRGNYRAGSINTQIAFTYYMTAGTTSSTTFRVWAAPDSGTLTLNGAGGAGLDNGAMFSSITVREIKA